MRYPVFGMLAVLVAAGTVLADGFEAYAPGVAPPAPWVCDPGTVVTNGVAFEGSQSLQMPDSEWSDAVLPLSIAPGESAQITLAVLPGLTPSGWNFSSTAYVGVRKEFGELFGGVHFQLDNLGYYQDSWDPVTAEDFRVYAREYSGGAQIGTYTPGSWELVTLTFTPTDLTIAAGGGVYTIARDDYAGNMLDTLELYGFRLAENGGTVVHYDAVEVVPEPASIALLGMAGLLITRRRR